MSGKRQYSSQQVTSSPKLSSVADEDVQVSNVYKVLNESGRLEQIRAQLRREIFTHLLESNRSANAVDIDLLTSTPGRLSLALIAGFVRRHFPATFSVFMAEANLAWLPVDDDESIILTRLGVPIDESHRPQPRGAMNVSALECIVQHLLRSKLNENDVAIKKSGEAKTSSSIASWQPILDDDRQRSKPPLVHGLAPEPSLPPTRSAESILADMRTLIREELASKDLVKKPPEPAVVTSHLHRESPRNEGNEKVLTEKIATSEVNNTTRQTLDSSGLDETRLHEYIEKMVERMMSTQRDTAIGSKQTKKADVLDKKRAGSAVGVVRADGPETNIVQQEPTAKAVTKDQKKKKKKMAASEAKSPKAQIASLKVEAGTKAATILPGGTATSSYDVGEARKRMSLPAYSVISNDRPGNVEIGNVSSMEETRGRLATLEQEAAKLESWYQKRVASIDSAQPLACTVGLIERLTASPNRRSWHVSSTVAGRVSLPTTSSGAVSSSYFSSKSNSRVVTSGTAATGSSSLIPGLLSSQRRQSPGLGFPPARSSTLSASSRALAMMRTALPGGVDNSANELCQSNNELISLPPANHRFLSSTATQSASRLNPINPFATETNFSDSAEHLPFSVFPNGIQPEVGAIRRQVQQQREASEPPPVDNAPLPVAVSAPSAAPPTTTPFHQPTIPALHKQPEAAKSHQHSPVEGHNVVVTTTSGTPPSYPRGKDSPSADQQVTINVSSGSFFSPSPGADNAREVAPSGHAVSTVMPVPLALDENTVKKEDSDFPLPPYSANPPEVEGTSAYVNPSKVSATTEHSSPSARAHLQPTYVSKTANTVAEEKSDEVAEVSEETTDETEEVSETVEEKQTGGGDVGGEEVDDVLKHYMEMVMQKRMADSQDQGKSSSQALVDDDDDEEEEEEEGPSPLLANRSRPKTVSQAPSGGVNDGSAANDDFWS